MASSARKRCADCVSLCFDISDDRSPTPDRFEGRSGDILSLWTQELVANKKYQTFSAWEEDRERIMDAYFSSAVSKDDLYAWKEFMRTVGRNVTMHLEARYEREIAALKGRLQLVHQALDDCQLLKSVVVALKVELQSKVDGCERDMAGFRGKVDEALAALAAAQQRDQERMAGQLREAVEEVGRLREQVERARESSAAAMAACDFFRGRLVVTQHSHEELRAVAEAAAAAEAARRGSPRRMSAPHALDAGPPAGPRPARRMSEDPAAGGPPSPPSPPPEAPPAAAPKAPPAAAPPVPAPTPAPAPQGAHEPVSSFQWVPQAPGPPQHSRAPASASSAAPASPAAAARAGRAPPRAGGGPGGGPRAARGGLVMPGIMAALPEPEPSAGGPAPVVAVPFPPQGPPTWLMLGTPPGLPPGAAPAAMLQAGPLSPGRPPPARPPVAPLAAGGAAGLGTPSGGLAGVRPMGGGRGAGRPLESPREAAEGDPLLGEELLAADLQAESPRGPRTPLLGPSPDRPSAFIPIQPGD